MGSTGAQDLGPHREEVPEARLQPQLEYLHCRVTAPQSEPEPATGVYVLYGHSLRASPPPPGVSVPEAVVIGLRKSGCTRHRTGRKGPIHVTKAWENVATVWDTRLSPSSPGMN